MMAWGIYASKEGTERLSYFLDKGLLLMASCVGWGGDTSALQSLIIFGVEGMQLLRWGGGAFGENYMTIKSCAKALLKL